MMFVKYTKTYYIKNIKQRNSKPGLGVLIDSQSHFPYICYEKYRKDRRGVCKLE